MNTHLGIADTAVIHTRGRSEVNRRSPDRRWFGVLAGAVALSCLLAAAVSFTRLATHDAGSISIAANVLLAFACGLFLTSGVVRLCRWRILRESRSALLGTAWLLLGAVSLPMGGLQRFLDHPDASLLSNAGRGASAVVCMGLVLRALTLADSREQVRLERLLPRIALLLAFFFFTLTGFGLLLGDIVRAGRGQQMMVAAFLAVGWLTVALVVTVRADSTAWAVKIAPLVTALGISEVLRVVGSGMAEIGWTLGALFLCVCVALFADHRAVNELDEAVQLDEARLADVSEALQLAHCSAERHVAAREEMTHDARNAFAGLRAALCTLQKYHGRLDSTLSTQLYRAAIEEIAHLEHLLKHGANEEVQRFDLADLVGLVVQTRRALGSDITVHTENAVACGRPQDVTTALQNLLVNAEVHAPGSPVEVIVETRGNRVLVTVADQGPGFTSEEASRIFGRGERGIASAGSGLGLHVALSLMRAQGGNLELLRHEGGATFRLSLAAAEVATSSVTNEPTVPFMGVIPQQRSREATTSRTLESLS